MALIDPRVNHDLLLESSGSLIPKFLVEIDEFINRTQEISRHCQHDLNTSQRGRLLELEDQLNFVKMCLITNHKKTHTVNRGRFTIKTVTDPDNTFFPLPPLDSEESKSEKRSSTNFKPLSDKKRKSRSMPKDLLRHSSQRRHKKNEEDYSQSGIENIARKVANLLKEEKKRRKSIPHSTEILEEFAKIEQLEEEKKKILFRVHSLSKQINTPLF